MYRTSLKLLVLACAIAALRIHAAGLVIGSPLSLKVVGSSTGAPCDFDCWERWTETGGLGSIMVVKDSAGHIIEAGHITDPYFYDLWISTDEAIRKIPTTQQITRYGSVRTVVAGNICQVNCMFTLDLGTFQDVVLGINTAGKLAAASAIENAVLNPLDDPHLPPVGYPNACPYNLPGPSCHVYGGSQYAGGITHITIWAVYDSNGNLLGWVIRFDNGPDKFYPFVMPK
jgi:hypothetical protein